MIDDAWVSELERRARPLRVELPPWGEVLAREALRAPVRDHAPRPWRWKVAALALATAAGAVWAWPRPAPRIYPSPATPRDHMIVATPLAVRPSAEVAPPPSPDPIEDALESVPPEPTPRPRVPRRARRPASPPQPRESMEVAPTVDCILDPRLCRPAKPAPNDDLPLTLGTNEIKRGIDRIRPQIHDCARVHGALPKQRVTIKISISGESGMVTAANIVQPKLAIGLEQCIVAAMHRATFPRFQKERLGAMFPVTLP